jgi:hypothetical protein
MAMLNEVERLEARSFPSTDTLREELAASGWRAHTAMTSVGNNSSVK